MIEINLARQFHAFPIEKKPSIGGYGWVGVVLCLGIGMAGWWWTHIQQQELEKLLQEKHVQTQSFDKVQTTLKGLEKYQEEKQTLKAALEAMQVSKFGSTRPIALLHGVSESLDGLEIWLDRIQMVEQVVELQGQSLALQDIGTFVDVLENTQIISSLPIVEILDQENQEKEKTYSFMIRFTMDKKVNT